jgi:hypothetical protein
MPPRKCCCPGCLIATDDFNRADNTDTGALWTQGNAEIVSETLVVTGITSITECHPSIAPDGSLWGQVVLKDCGTNGPFQFRLGNPSGDIEVLVTFAGTMGAGGTMTIAVSGDGESASFAYDWENTDEPILFCYDPEVQVSAGPGISRTVESPDWVTICVSVTGAHCWVGDTVGNFHFLDGTFDDFRMEIHKRELASCPECDCYCYQIVSGVPTAFCIPSTIHLELTTACPDISGTYEMVQSRALEVFNDSPPTTTAWSQKFQWISAVIACPAADSSVHRFAFILECIKGTGEYPRFLLRLIRWGDGLVCSGLGFDPFDPDTYIPSAQGQDYYDSQAYSTAASDCDPFTLYFPEIIETDYGCSNCWEDPDPPSSSPISCCGGCVVSGVGISDDVTMTVVITE